jgi:hypothetical protein
MQQLMPSVPIADDALCLTGTPRRWCAEETRSTGSAFSRFESPPVCARLFDDDAGHFSVHPAQQPADSHHYLDDTVALKTPWVTSA